MAKVNNQHVGWSFWRWWMLASTVSILLGWLTAFLWNSELGFVFGETVGVFVNFAVVGFVVGILQWLVLRQHLSRASWWVLANTLGFVIFGFLAPAFLFTWTLGLGRAVGVFVIFAVVGFVVGILQWLVLRQHLSRAGWWVLASTVGHVTLGWRYAKLWVGDATLGPVAGTVAGIALYGAITGGALVWLLRQPKLEE